jgi:hypothetical protein
MIVLLTSLIRSLRVEQLTANFGGRQHGPPGPRSRCVL